MYQDDNIFNVDTTNVEKMGGYEVYPAGLYNAMLISASKKATAKNDGMYIECVYQFIDGDYNGKKFTSRMNLWNQNSQAVDIAKRELKSLRAAVGLPDTESNLQQFINKPLVLNISAKARKDDPTKAENNLVSIEPYSGAPSRVANPAPPAHFAPQPQPQPQQMAMPHMTPPQMQQPTAQTPPPAFQPQPGGAMPWMVGAR